MNRFALAVALILVTLATAFSQTADSANKHRATIEALRGPGGLREAARIQGHYVGRTSFHEDWIQYDIATFTRESDLIVTGVPVSNRCHLTADGKSITTDYVFRIDQLHKGRVKPGAQITVPTKGGKVMFDDGTSVELIVEHFTRFET